jgi:hypothetical protein
MKKKKSKSKAPVWVTLNSEGMKIFGKIFPDKRVPLLSFIPSSEILWRPGYVECWYSVSWSDLSREQQEMLLTILQRGFRLDREKAKALITLMGVPIRGSHVEFSDDYSQFVV